MAEKWLGLKFGGTSVTARQQWETIASIVRARRSDGYRVLLVCSAVSGVTNLLESRSEQVESETPVAEILQIHCVLADQLGGQFRSPAG